MAIADMIDDSNSAPAPTDRVRLLLSKYRAVGYSVASILGLWFLGYAVDIAAGPYNDSTELAHTISGLLGAMAIVIAICAVVVGVLWGSLLVTSHSKRSGA